MYTGVTFSRIQCRMTGLRADKEVWRYLQPSG